MQVARVEHDHYTRSAAYGRRGERSGRHGGGWRRLRGGEMRARGVRRGRGLSLTDLHKGTHNCAAAIRESGAGISPSPSTPPPPRATASRSPLVVHPRSSSTLDRPPSSARRQLRSLLAPARDGWDDEGERGRGRWCPGTQSVRSAIIFPHEWAAVSVVPGLVLRCFSCCIFSPPLSLADTHARAHALHRPSHPFRSRVLLCLVLLLFPRSSSALRSCMPLPLSLSPSLSLSFGYVPERKGIVAPRESVRHFPCSKESFSSK